MARWVRLLAGRLFWRSRLHRTLPPAVRSVWERLDRAGGAWLVGGCVRDLLLGINPADWDLATALGPEAVQQLFPRTVSYSHGTVLVIEDGATVEVTTLRGEQGALPRRAALEADLARRDFTIGAMAIGREGLIDPLGGWRDLLRGVVRACGSPADRFREDPLRLMRAVRIAAQLRFQIEPQTRAAIQGLASELATVSPERVRDELSKTLLAPWCAWGLEQLRVLGLLAHTVPELLEMVGVAQNKYHAYPVWEHTLLVIANAPARLPVRLAALLHDIGKPRTLSVDEKGERHFYKHEEVSGQIAAAILERLRFDHATRDRVLGLVRNHMLVRFDPTATDTAVRRMVRKVGRENLEDQLALWAADGTGTGKADVSPAIPATLLYQRIRELEETQAPFSVGDLAANGEDVMQALGIGPGPDVGEALRWLFEQVEEERLPNEREALLNALQERQG